MAARSFRPDTAPRTRLSGVQVNSISVLPMAQSSARPVARLKKRPQFLHVAKGTKAAMPGLIVQARRRPEGPDMSPEISAGAIRIGFTATRKIGNAVVRNRTKRRLREAARRIMPLYGRNGFDYVLVGRSTTAARPFDALCDDLQRALMRIHQERKTMSANQ